MKIVVVVIANSASFFEGVCVRLSPYLYPGYLELWARTREEFAPGPHLDRKRGEHYLPSCRKLFERCSW